MLNNENMDKIPRSITDNYSVEIVEERINWLKKKDGN